MPHGCDGSATTELRIQMPESIPEVTPTRNANWTASKVTEALDTPITDPEGAQFTERVSEVVYTAITPLPDGYRDVFELAVNIPDDAAGTRLYFPTIQTCEVGETAWIELPAEGQDPEELEHPAPSVMVVAPPADATTPPTLPTALRAPTPERRHPGARVDQSRRCRRRAGPRPRRRPARPRTGARPRGAAVDHAGER